MKPCADAVDFAPVRIVAFNTAEGWSRDVTEEIATELAQACADRSEIDPSIGQPLVKISPCAPTRNHHLAGLMIAMRISAPAAWPLPARARSPEASSPAEPCRSAGTYLASALDRKR
jgi:hypothetical protein